MFANTNANVRGSETLSKIYFETRMLFAEIFETLPFISTVNISKWSKNIIFQVFWTVIKLINTISDYSD